MKKGLLPAIATYVLWGVLPIYWKQLSNIPAAESLAHRVLEAGLLLCCLRPDQKAKSVCSVGWSVPGNRPGLVRRTGIFDRGDLVRPAGTPPGGYLLTPGISIFSSVNNSSSFWTGLASSAPSQRRK